MTLKQIKALERQERDKLSRNRQRIAAKTGVQCEFPPAVRSAGMVMGLSDEDQKAWFEKMRKESGVV